MVKNPLCNAGDPGPVPGLGRSPGEENGNPLQCSCKENPMDRGAWRAVVRRVVESQTRLHDHVHTHKKKHKHYGKHFIRFSLSNLLIIPFKKLVLKTNAEKEKEKIPWCS